MCHLSSCVLARKKKKKQTRGRGSGESDAYFASVRRHDEKGLDVVFLEEGVSLVAKARFHLVVAIQTLQRGSRDVNLTENKKRAQRQNGGFESQCCFGLRQVLFGFATPNTDPGNPPASITLAKVTSLDQTSYCHFLRPSTPHSTRPVWRPTRIFKSTSVASTTDLREKKGLCGETVIEKIYRQERTLKYTFERSCHYSGALEV